MPSEESGLGVSRQESTSIVSQAATSLSTRPTTPPLAPPSANANVSESAGLSESQSHALFDSRNVVITGGQFHNTLGHHTSFVVHINHSTSEGNTADSQSESNSPPSNLNETHNMNSAQFFDQSSQDNHERSNQPQDSQSQEISSQKPNDIYERHLTMKERGFPLWIPDPDQNLHLDYRRTGIRIGDVGIITDSGAFSFLFNICLPQNDPLNPRMLPEHFTPISPPIEASDIGKFRVFKNGSHLASASVKISQKGSAISDIIFESSASEGAILTMPRGARSEDLRNKATFREYAAANIANWYRYANGPRGLEAKNGEVRLVVGFDKATSWGIATFANQTQQNSCRLKFGPSERDSASTTYTWSQLEYSGVADVKAGPDSDEIDELRIDGDPPHVQFENQCLFVRTLNATLADDVWAEIHSTSGSILVDSRNSQYPRVKNYSNSNRSHWNNPDNGSDFSPSQGAQSGTQRRLQGIDIMPDDNLRIFISGPVESIASTAHPSKVLNDTLLAKIPTAKMVITHDGDWSSQYDTVLDPHELVANILASRDICEDNGVVFLEPKKIINEIPGPISMDHAQVPDAAVVQLEDPIAPYVSLTHIGQRRALVPETAVVQLEDLTAHNVLSPPLNSDRGEMYVNQHTANIKVPSVSQETFVFPPGRFAAKPESPKSFTLSSVLDLSHEFAQPSPSPEHSSQYSSTYTNHVNFRYQNIPQPPSSGVLSPNAIPPATGSPYVPDSPTSSKYPQVSMTKHSDQMASSSIQRQLSPTPSGPPDYRSTYSSPMESLILFAITNNSTRRDNQYTSYQFPSAFGSSLPSPQTEIAALSASRESTGSLPFQYSTNGPNENQYSSSPKRKFYERRRDSSLSLAGYSGLPNSSPSTSTANGTRQSPSSPNVIFTGSRLSKIPPVSPIVQPTNQTNRPHDEGFFGLSDDYRRKVGPSVNQEIFFFPPGRSAAHPEKPPKPKYPKSSIHSSKSNDDNPGRFRMISKIFKKGKNTPPDRQISEESSYEFIAPPEQTRALKSTYPLDPYNSVSLDNDRHTGKLLSRLNRTGSPVFHDYVTPPSSVLDLGCGQGHWILEAAIAWEGYGTHVTGLDMVDISSNLLLCTPQGVRNNIRFVKGNFLKEQLPFNNDTFDLVRMSCLALCITSDSWGYILREVCRVLMAGGRLEFIDDQIFLPFSKEPLLTEGHDDGFDHDGGGVVHDHKGKGREKLNPSIALSPEASDRSLSISDLDALFEDMLLDAFDIYKDPSDFVLPLMAKIFGHAQEVVTMNLLLAPPDLSGRSPQHCSRLTLWPSDIIPMDHTEVEIHASKHLNTLLSCKNHLAQYAIKVAELEGEIVDEEFVSQALWKYESFVRHRFNPRVVPVPASGSSAMPNELTHVRTFRVFEAVKGRKNWI